MDLYWKMIFGTTEDPDVQAVLDRISEREQSLCTELTTNPAGGPGREVRIRSRLKFTMKDLILLRELKGNLPFLTRLWIEDLCRRRLPKPGTLEASNFLDYQDKLYARTDQRFLVGRVRARLLKLLKSIRVFLWTEPRTRSKNRPRTPSGAVGSRKLGESYNPEISNKTAWEEESHQEYLRSQFSDLEEATHILAKERELRSTVEAAQILAANSPALEVPSEGNNATQPAQAGLCALEDSLGKEFIQTYQGRPEVCKYCPPSLKNSCAYFAALVNEPHEWSSPF